MRLAATCLIVLLVGCDDRSSFDKRYDETANEIQNRAARIDTDLNTATIGPEADATPVAGNVARP